MIQEYLNLSTIEQVIKKLFKQRKLIPAFARKVAFQRWASAIFISAILSFLLTPQVHFSYPGYKAGSTAARDVRVDRDILVEDKASGHYLLGYRQESGTSYEKELKKYLWMVSSMNAKLPFMI